MEEFSEKIKNQILEFAQEKMLGKYHSELINVFGYPTIYFRQHSIQLYEGSLQKISNFLSVWIQQEKFKHRRYFFSNIERIASNKRWYLNELDVRYMNRQFEMDYLKSYHQDLTGMKTEEGKEYIFSIDLTERLLLIPATKTIHHVSLSHGKPVLGSGNMTVSQGKITSIQLESGHYLPTLQNGLQILDIFKKMNIFLEPSTPFTYYDSLGKHEVTVGEFQFKESGVPGIILDRIYSNQNSLILIHGIEPAKVDNHFPSDHMPVVVDFLIRGKKE